MNRKDRKEIEEVHDLADAAVKVLNVQHKNISERAKKLRNNFPEHKRLERLEDEAVDLDNAIQELELARAYIRQALDGR